MLLSHAHGDHLDDRHPAVKMPAHLPLSGRTMEFNGKGKCVGGC